MQGHSASSPYTARGTPWGLTVGVRQMKTRRAQGTAQSSMEFTVLDPHHRCSSGERLEDDSVWLAYYGPDMDVQHDSWSDRNGGEPHENLGNVDNPHGPPAWGEPDGTAFGTNA